MVIEFCIEKGEWYSLGGKTRYTKKMVWIQYYQLGGTCLVLVWSLKSSVYHTACSWILFFTLFAEMSQVFYVAYLG